MSLDGNKNVYVYGYDDDREIIDNMIEVLEKLGYQNTSRWYFGSGVKFYSWCEDIMDRMKKSDLVIINIDYGTDYSCEIQLKELTLHIAFLLKKEIWIVSPFFDKETSLYKDIENCIFFKSWKEVFSELHPI
jgi:hypothetical protein